MPMALRNTGSGFGRNRILCHDPEDIWQERLYAIQWITKDSLNKAEHETFFAAVTDDDLARERQVEAIVCENIQQWQEGGLTPDTIIVPGEKTDEPIRTRGWTYWHHLFSARQLLFNAVASETRDEATLRYSPFCQNC